MRRIHLLYLHPKWCIVTWQNPGHSDSAQQIWLNASYDGRGWVYASVLGLELNLRLWGHKWL